MATDVDASQMRQSDGDTDGSVSAHLQDTHIIEEDHPRDAAGIGRFGEQCANQDIGASRLVDHHRPELVEFVAESGTPFCQRTVPEIGSSRDDGSGWFATGMRIDDLNGVHVGILSG